MAGTLSGKGMEVNIDNVLSFLQGELNKSGKIFNINVGYSAPHAIFVHEDLTANHPNGGQAKYLEAASRNPSTIEKMRSVLRDKLRNKKGLRQAVIAAGQVLLEESQKLVPIDTGELRNSGFLDIGEGD